MLHRIPKIWCSSHHTTFETIDNSQWGDHTTSLPIILDDFSFMTESQQCTTNIQSIHDDNIVFTILCICKQKNNYNWQKLTYQHWVDFLGCVQHRPALILSAVPIALVPLPTWQQQYTWMLHQVNAAKSQLHRLQTYLPLGPQIFSIPGDHQDLCTWLCYFIWVTSANLLYRAHYSDSDIKNRICWHNDTFLMYLQSTLHTAYQHTKAITLGLDPASGNLVYLLEPHEQLLLRPPPGQQMHQVQAPIASDIN